MDFSESDIDKIDIILNQYLVDAKMWICNFYSYDMPAIESRLFAGNIDFFLENFILVKSIDDWYNKYPFSTTSDTLENILPKLVNHTNESIYATNTSISEFFNSSKFDVCDALSFINIAYNIENKFEPLLFIITKNGKYNVIIDNKTVLNKDCIHNEWVKIRFTISDDLSNLKVLFNDSVVFEENINLENIENFKNKCVVYKL